MSDLKKLTLYEYEPHPQLVTKETAVAKAKFTAIDAHNHLRRLAAAGPEAIGEYVKVMDEQNVQAVVDLDGGWGEALQQRLEMLKKPHRDRFYIFARIDWSRIDEQSFSERAVEQLEESVAMGAQGLKISKRLGLGVKVANGSYLPVDTPLLDPIWAKCGELGIPVLIHTSDPTAFFTPLDRHNERLEELVDRPEWMFNKPEFYPKEELLSQRNRVIARHPGTKFIGAHVGSMPENLGRVADWLEQYPNLFIDMSARISELGRQPYTARRFFTKYADRILLGTDGNAMGQPLKEMYGLHWRFFETDDEYFDVAKSHKFQARWQVYGLHLPDDVLKKVYQTNALRLIPGAAVTIEE